TPSTSGALTWTESEIYHTSNLIPVEIGEYSFDSTTGLDNPVRSYRLLSDETTVIQNTSNTAIGKNITITNPSAKFLLAVFYNTIPINGFSVAKGENVPYEPYSEDSSYEYLSREENIVSKSPNSVVFKKDLDNINFEDTVVVDIQNSDKFMIIGSSSVESF